MTADFWRTLTHSMGRVIVFVLLLTGVVWAQDVETIIQRSVQANESDWAADPQYDHYETDQEDGDPPQTFEVQMILGSPYKRLVAVNGKELSPEQQQAEGAKMQQVIARRRAETPEQRAQRIAKWEKDRKRDHLMMEQLTQAFEFKLLGQQRLGTHQVYVLKATPRPGYKPPNMQAQVLTGMQGKLWIDTQTFQWVKVQAKVIRPVSIEGFLATVEPGTHFELEKAPVGDGVWEPTHFSMKSQAKVFFLFNHRSQENDVYFGYRRSGQLSVASKTGGP
ncbi:MAG TPA: hypothetical protein VJ756_09820 [Terriglobales bacterium]|nr:hypothetical protein [Terriglobales bacterium]